MLNLLKTYPIVTHCMCFPQWNVLYGFKMKLMNGITLI